MPVDTQVPLSAVTAAPSEWTIPGNVELRLKAVSALFTDNGAAGAWLPAVVIRSDSGHVIARALLPEVSVSAGDDAEVSWFPGVKPSAAAASTGGGAAYATADNFDAFTTFTVPDNIATPITFPTFTTSDSTVFGTSLNGSASPHNQPNDNTLILRAPGVYKVSSAVTWTGLNFARYSYIVNVGGTDASDLHGVTPASDFSAVTSSTGSRSWWVDNATYIVQSGQTSRLQFQAYQNTGSNQHISAANFSAVYWTFAGFANQMSY